MNDYELALQCQAQYDGKIPLRTVAEVVYSIVQNPNGVIDIIFRGTSDIEDAKEDLEALMMSCLFGSVHSGAWEGIQAVLDAENILNDGKLILCTGHSLGAMRAQLAYRELYRRGYSNIKCVTFECPRFGDADATKYATIRQMDNTYQNYKNLFEHDSFTMIPLHLPLEPYAEVPNCKQFWSAPTSSNEWNGYPLNIQAHSLSNCVIPYLKTVFP